MYYQVAASLRNLAEIIDSIEGFPTKVEELSGVKGDATLGRYLPDLRKAQGALGNPALLEAEDIEAFGQCLNSIEKECKAYGHRPPKPSQREVAEGYLALTLLAQTEEAKGHLGTLSRNLSMFLVA